MQTVTIQLLKDDALALLLQLEQLDILKLVSNVAQTDATPPRQWAGSISEATANRMLHETAKSREEWKDRI